MMKTFLSILCLLFSAALGQTTCNQCKFDGSDASDCRLYGQLGDRVLIPWYKASQECLDFYNIKVQAIDPDELSTIFPNSDGSGGSVTGFVNWLRFTEGSVASSVKAGFPQFWEETDTGAIVLRSSITDTDGSTVDCEANASDCYTAIRNYFSVEPGASKMAAVGRTLYQQAALDREKEQSSMRIRLCQEGLESTCDPLSTQVEMIKSENPDSACSAFGLGPAEVQIPGCEDNPGPSPTPGTSGFPARGMVQSIIVLVGAVGLNYLL